MEGDRVVNTISEECDIDAGASGDLDEAGLLVRSDAREDGRDRNCDGQCVVVEMVDLSASENAGDRDLKIATDLARDDSVVSGDDLDGDPEPIEFRDGCSCARLWAVDERQEASQPEVLLVVGRWVCEAWRRPGGDSDDAGTLLEELFEDGGSRGWDVDASGQNRLRRALCDEGRATAALRDD